MSVFGIDALFFDPAERTVYCGESKAFAKMLAGKYGFDVLF